MDDIFGGYYVYHLYGNDLSKLVLSMVTIYEDDTNGDQLSCVVEEVRLPPIPESELPYFPTYIKASSHSNGIIHMADPENEGTSVLLNPILGEFDLLIRQPGGPYYSKFTGDDLTLHGLAEWGFGVYKCVKIYVDEC
ncbi:hypothetical protein PanWU01x14_043760 [Parasponia andersonii]|uniref:Uncharacterized protein n=1 Tax=Parasponia andersonii TaxID=3476 RepID=A0A2P5DQ74_PARAD|nr:hypothetical protein PanWU01x14_043760 [Parasponia andersonii]